VFKADVTDEQQVRRLEMDVREKFGNVQILINNAGINLRKPVTEFTLDEWRQVMDTNVTGVFLMCRSFVPHLKGRGYGRILNMTSIMSTSPCRRTAYCTSKTALLGFTRALAWSLRPDKVTVNGISPGPFATELERADPPNPELNQQFISKIPLGRWGEPEEVGHWPSICVRRMQVTSPGLIF